MEIAGLTFEGWHIWLMSGIALIILEIFAPGFVLGCLAIGCLGGLIADLFGASIAIQLIASSAVALIAFVTIRPLVLRTMHSNSVRTNVDSLIGRAAQVTLEFDPKTKLGRVKVDGDDWRAESTESVDLKQGSMVEIIKVESNTLIIKPQ